MTVLDFTSQWHDKGVSKGLKNTGDDLDRTGDKVNRFRQHAGVAFAAVGAAVLAFGVTSVKAYAESEQAQAKLDDAYARFPKLADTNIEALRELNAELAKKTRFDDDAFASGQAVLAQFNLTGKQVKNITPLLADYAAKTGQSLPDAAAKLGKSFLGNTKALKELGINYKSTGDQAKDTENIIQLLRGAVGGFAEKEGQTATGRAEILKNQFGELQEQVGAKLMPALMKLAEVGLAALKWIDENRGSAMIIGGIVGAVWLLNAALAANPVVLIATGIALLVAGIIILWTRCEGFRNFIIGAWEVIKTAFTGSIASIVAGFTGFIQYLVARFQAFIDFWISAWNLGKQVFSTAIDAIKTGFQAFVQFFVDLWHGAKEMFNRALESIKTLFRDAMTWVTDKAKGVLEWFRYLPANMTAALMGLFGAVTKPFKDAFNWVREKVAELTRWVGDRVDEMIRKIGSIATSHQAAQARGIGGLLAKLGFAATGGHFGRNEPVVVGERGPEIWWPDTAGTVIPNHRAFPSPMAATGRTAGMSQTVTVRLTVDGADSELLRLLRKLVKVEGGGNVQTAFGRS